MQAVRSRNTAPEITVRRLCREVGAPGYRLHRLDLPGKPDIVFVGRRLAMFVNGCFWHGHHCPAGAKQPRTNTEYWEKKIERTRSRDARNLKALAQQQWRILVIWECETRQLTSLKRKLRRFLKAQH